VNEGGDRAKNTLDVGLLAPQREVQGICDSFDENLTNEMECERDCRQRQKAY
jgi:hypothetical protein